MVSKPSIDATFRARSSSLVLDSCGVWLAHDARLSCTLRLPPDQAGRKETALDLAKFVDKGVQVKLTGGRQG